MATCAYLELDNSIRVDGSTCDFYLLDPSEYAQFQTVSAGSLPVDDPSVNALISSIIFLLVLAWVFRQVLNQLIPKGI